MGQITLIFLLIFLIIDQPFKKNSTLLKDEKNKKWIKGMKLVILLSGAIHGVYNWVIGNQITSKLISGIFMMGLIIAYMMSGDHEGIEDRMARTYFRRLTWIVIFIIFILHIIYPFSAVR